MRFVTERLEDVLAAIVTLAVGIFVVTEGSSYKIGTLSQMGPGYFPVILGWTMIVLAVLILASSRPAEIPMTLSHRQLRGMLFVAASFAAFALTIERFGMVPSITLTVFLASLANDRNTLVKAGLLGLGSALACALIFRVGLGLQIEAF
ncbi:MAG: tripartite tricarboxylate transporter TctB family protein [Pseudomonadota bacterium]|nr:tripartite tricarboxylate transporter TctB family protein [Pseudomonadota bacterium]MEC8667225.1 tripartite tricarboxylate transporter TctB family protein [Pseudomonadota bacterium]